jgi:hypothetical protein
MQKLIRLATAALLASTLLWVTPASANDSDVIREGNCSAASDWKLKLSEENGRIEVDFEVDQNVVGETWQVVLKQNGVTFFRGTRVTQAPSGSFEVRRVTDNLAGDDHFVGLARNVSTGETCRGAAIWTL